tara:strand:+ start:384 stop:692 length:309 start_codon:yes stop_codon:yes gene_type:complete
MQAQVRLKKDDAVRTYGIRATAVPYRDQIECALPNADSIVVDFSNHDATQSFVDELVGALVLRHGRPVLSKLIFENCTSQVKAIIRFVVQDRLAQISSRVAA